MEEVLDQHLEQERNISDGKATYRFKNTSANELAKKVEKYLLEKGYKREDGTLENATYGKGNKVLRILLGAFIKRFTWAVKVSREGNVTRLDFIKAEKGQWGGIIGVQQVKSELKRIVEALNYFHTNFEKKDA